MLTHVIAAFLASCDQQGMLGAPAAGDRRMLNAIAPRADNKGRKLSSCLDAFEDAFVPGAWPIIYSQYIGGTTTDPTSCGTMLNLMTLTDGGGGTWEMTCGYTLERIDAAFVAANLAGLMVNGSGSVPKTFPNQTYMFEICEATCAYMTGVVGGNGGYDTPCTGWVDDLREPTDLGFTEIKGDNTTLVSSDCGCWEWNAGNPDYYPTDKDVVAADGLPGCCASHNETQFGYIEGVHFTLHHGRAAPGTSGNTNGTVYPLGATPGQPSFDVVQGGIQNHAECAQLCLDTPRCTGIEVREYRDGSYYNGAYCKLWYDGACGGLSADWFYMDNQGTIVCQTYTNPNPKPDMPPPPTPPPPSPPPPSPSPPATTAGDPTTTYRGRETRYWLNMERPTPVFEQGPIRLSQLAGPANPPPGLEAHKGDWVVAMEVDMGGLDKIRIETVDPKALLAPPNASAPVAADDRRLTTVRLSAGGKNLAAGEHELSTLGATVTASRVTGPEMQELKMGNGFVERIDIKAAGLHLRITSAKANKFADEALQVLGLHLDLAFLTFDQGAALGALPEMWGLQPMSEATKTLLAKPAAA